MSVNQKGVVSNAAYPVKDFAPTPFLNIPSAPLVPFREILRQAKAEISEAVDTSKTLSLLRWPNQRGERNRIILHEITKEEAILIDRLLAIPGIRQNARDSDGNMPTHAYCRDGNVYAVVR
ncbi:MAG: hypothetical protein KGH53_03430, partial [Candidatus Micrarchaeota archaeon]|nr:hypothetical protein [Candidatus Micrarchaeota archaeon]